jgi:SNF2 family DNA or RNA helicase
VKSWQPHDYQLRAVQWLLDRRHAGLFLDPGLGKTSTVLAALTVLRKRALIIAPLRVCYSVWPREVEKWADFSHLSVAILHGTKKEAALARKADIDVINPEGLKWLLKRQHERYDILVVDESTKFKHVHTQRFKLLKTVLPSFERRWILTGTPAPNGLMDLFGQAYLLDQGQRLGRFITHYRNAFFFEKKFPTHSEWLPLRGAGEAVFNQLSDVCLRMSAEDYLTLPECLYNDVRIDIPMRDYEELRKEYVVQLERGEITAANAAAKLVKLRQMANGAVYDEHRRTHVVHEAKLDALEDLVEEQSGQPLLVAVAFQHDVEQIRGRLGAVPYLGGGTSASASAKLVDQWNRGELPVLLAHPASVGHGVNLQAGGRAVAWFGLDWNLELYEQFNRRIYRQGQSHGVVIHHLVATGTVDEQILAALQQKEQLQTRLLKFLKETLDAPKDTR